MRLKVVPSGAECHLPDLRALAHTMPISLFSLRRDRSIPPCVLSHSFVCKNPLNFQTLHKKLSRDCTICSCCMSFEGLYDEESSFHVQGLAKSFKLSENEGHRNRLHGAISKRKISQDSFSNLQFDLLEPIPVGVRPEVQDWPDRETVTQATIEQKAKSFGIPLSLRMIKKKLQCEEMGIKDITSGKDSAHCSVKPAFSSMVFIVVELQIYAIRMRESLLTENLDKVTAKVQREMHSSFIWLFQQVLSKTPCLMIYVMILLANYSVYSTCPSEFSLLEVSDLSTASTSFSRNGEITVDENTAFGDLPQSSQYVGVHSGSIMELILWNSVVDAATKMQGFDCEVLDYKTKQRFVSPVSMDVGSDGYEEHLNTQFLYQVRLSYEPNNQLLLCNYGQFLYLIAHDYDRAEECFKRATQVLPSDAESLCQYANFL